MIPPCQGTDSINDHADGIPDKSGDFFWKTTKNLEINPRHVRWGDGIRNKSQCNNYTAELSEAVQGSETFDEKGTLAGVVCSAERGRGWDGAGEPDADEKGEGEGGY